ncbi:cysteine--tRNA ligase [uncultured Sphingomonas sp.]|uniref:cysteine--tRNA ligase n=1 Tax=uncultured Sphingomonas sp. TaxID=158754 RepID=UPI0035CB8A15
MSSAPLTFYNSLLRAVELFRPLDPADVRVYSCGPTVYDYAHLGNLRAYVFTDTLARTLRWKGYSLTHVMNVTDVGHLQSDADEGADKMEARARSTGQDIWAIARHYTDAFKRDLRDLNVRDVDRLPLATDHIAEMIAFAKVIDVRHCYLLDGGLYFDTTTVPNYGRLAGHLEDGREGRIDVVAGKRHPEDFAIWRRSAPGENRQMEWESPWGRGAPGWHLECSVMSRLYLGERFDIHTGGIDHREIHHPNEIAQNQAYHRACHGHADEAGFTGATVWMHNNFLVERAGKMSKSSGGFLTLQAAVDRGFHPLAYRLMCLQAHYRSEMEFSWDGLAAAATRLKRLVQAIGALRTRADAEEQNDALGLTPTITGRLDDFDQAISDDLSTPRALVSLDRLLALKNERPALLLSAAARMDEVLGLSLLSLDRADLRVHPANATIDPPAIEASLAERRGARADGDFPRADAIRHDLAQAGVDVMDGDPLGWDWK